MRVNLSSFTTFLSSPFQTRRIELACNVINWTELDILVGLYDAVAIEVGGEFPMAIDVTAREVGLQTAD